MKIRLVDDLAQDPQATNGKFVLLEQEQSYCLVRSSMRICEYHAQIFARYAASQGISVQLNRDESDLRTRPQKLSIHGGGYWEQTSPGRVRLYAKSAAFGPFDHTLIEGLGIQSDIEFFVDL